MMEKIIRGVLVGVIAGIATLVGLGWNAYGKISDMGKSIKSEVKSEMMEVRNRDMEYINQRFNLVEKLMVGKVVNQLPIPEVKDKTE